MKRSLVVVLGACAVLVARTPALPATCSPSLCIESSMTSTGGSTADPIAAAHVNGDSLPDVVTASGFPSYGISVLLGNPDGTFQPAVFTPTSDKPLALVTGDFDGDGKDDVAVSFWFGGSVYLSNGDGTFKDPIGFETPSGGAALAAGRFDANATLDLIAVGSGMSIYLGNGDGTFQPPVSYAVSSSASGVVTADFDGDGKADVALTADNSVDVYPGLGDGTFSASIPTVAGIAVSGPAAADVDGDGKLDLVVTTNGFVGVLRGNGDFTFQAAEIYAAGPFAERATPVDLDGDGKPDLAIASVAVDYSPPPAGVYVLFNDGDGTFRAGPAYPTLDYPSGPVAVDLDGDGTPDLLVGGGTHQVSSMLNLGDGSLASARLEGMPQQSALAAADFDGDGYLDIVVGTDGSNLVVARGTPDGSFVTPAPTRPVAPAILVLTAAAVADFNGDERLDVVAVSTTYNHEFVFFAGNGDGTFQPAVLYDFPGGSLTTSLVIADFNGDGHPDAAFSDASFNTPIGQVTVFLGNGDGTFTLSAAMTLPSSLYGGLAAARFDGDADVDIVVAGEQPLVPGGTLFFLRGRGDGTFDLPVPTDLANSPFALSAGELRQPGVQDLVVGFGNAPPSTALLAGGGDGTFGPPQSIASYEASRSAVVDLDADGHPDVVLTDYAGNLVVVRNLGAGAFGAPEVSPDARATGPILIGDVEGNGTPDVLVGLSPLGIVVMKNARLGAGLYGLDAIVGSAAVWTVHATGYRALTYQWRKGGVPLSDGGTISGSQTATLTISTVSFSDAGSYDVVVTDACGQTTSNPAALAVEFADVPVSSPFHDDILTIATAGITSGCGGGNYCPASPVRRDQMAVFLLKSEHGSSYTPPACSGVFSDVACPSPFADWIEQLALEGVTSGCGGGHYCPSSSVTRAQMAVFLLKTKNGSSYVPPPATGIFGDVPVGSFAADFIEALYNQAITGGCQASPLLYCPGNAVLRQQMASFLVRTFAP